MDALQLFREMNHAGMEPNRVTFLTLLSACAKLGSLAEGRMIHACVIEWGLQSDIAAGTALINMYDKCGSLEGACTSFEKMHLCNVVAWTSMIATYAGHGHDKDALFLFWHMQRKGMEPNELTFMSVLSACTSQTALYQGRLIHALVLLNGLDLKVGLGTALVTMYGKCGTISDAASVFGKLQPRNLISWTAMMTAYVEHEHHEESLIVFQQMQLEGIKPDKVAFTIALNACASLLSLVEGRQTHTSIIYTGFESDILIVSALVDMYGKSGALDDAYSVFCKVHQRDAVLWSAMISGCVLKGYGKEALELFQQMQEKGVEPDEVTFVSVLGACGSPEVLGEGRIIHSCFIETGCSSDLVRTGLITMYGSCGALVDAQIVFQAMQHPDVVAWNAVMATYVQHGDSEKAMELFLTMQLEGYDADEVTFISILSACAGLAVLKEGRNIHSLIIKAGFQSHSLVENGLINFYGKCGALEDVCVVFDKLCTHNVVSWTAVLTAYAQQGLGKEALEVFDQMQQEGVKPDKVTLISLLSACNHAGMISEGHNCFVSLSQDYDVRPTVEHLFCIVDLLGRAGQLGEAENLIFKIPLEINAAHWSSLLGASTVHNNSELGRRAATYMFGLDPCVAPPCVWIAKLYSADSLWDEAEMEQTCWQGVDVDTKLIGLHSDGENSVSSCYHVGEMTNKDMLLP